MVVRSGDAVTLEVRLPIEFVNDALTWQLQQEQGAVLSGQLTPIEGELVGVAEFEEMECQAYRVTLDVQPALGYHQLILLEEGNDEPLATMRLIVAPKSCYKQAPIANGRKVWGPSVQLYCLRSRHNWGIGDFSDLGQLVEKAAAWGAHFVGLNPIHALYPANPESASPYSPSSRRWLNVAYIDVEAVPEFLDNERLKAEVASPAFQQHLTSLRVKDNVDYTGVIQTKIGMLRQVFDQASFSAERQAAFDAFVAAGGDSLQQQAAFDALQAHFYAKGDNAWGWPVWPEQFRDYHNPAVAAWMAEHNQDVAFYLYLQFLVLTPLEQRVSHGRYLLIAVGASVFIYVVFRHGFDLLLPAGLLEFIE